MKQSCNISIYLIFLLFFAVSCGQPISIREGSKNIEEALNKISEIRNTYPDSARTLLNTLWNENEKRLTNKERFRVFAMQGAIAQMNSEFAVAKERYEEALQTAKQMNDSLRQAQMYMNIAVVQQVQSDLQNALNSVRNAEKLLGGQQGYDMDVTIAIHNRKGSILARIGEMDSALYYIETALDLARSENHRLFEVAILMELTQIHIWFSNHEQANRYIQEAIIFFEEENDNANLSNVYMMLATNLIALNRIEDALIAAQKSDEIAASIGMPQLARHSIYAHQGKVLFEKGDYRNSLLMYRKALDIQRKTQAALFAVVKSKIGISRAYSSLNEHDKSIAYATEALNMVQENDILIFQIEAYRNLAFIHARYGNNEQFEQAMEAEATLRDSLFTQQRIKAIQELQIRYETEQKQLIIAQQKETIRYQNTQKILISIVSVIVILLFTLIFFFQRHKVQNAIRIVRQYEQLSAYKKKEERVAKTANANSMRSKLSRDLQHLFEVEKIYRQQGLLVGEVIEKLGTNRANLSQLLNQEYQRNFKDLVNTYRVAEAREALKNNEYSHYTVQAISELVGFKHPSVFYTAFKQEAGVTPTEYRSAIKQMVET